MDSGQGNDVDQQALTENSGCDRTTGSDSTDVRLRAISASKENDSPHASGEDNAGASSSKETGDRVLPIDLNSVDRLLDNQRREIMYELRRLQHGDRPVTGRGSKEAVEAFFNRALSRNDDRSTFSATSNNTPEHRPESIIVEVNALVERRPVSSLLQSARFRQNLERTLRTAFSSGSRGGSVARSLDSPQRVATPAASGYTSPGGQSRGSQPPEGEGTEISAAASAGLAASNASLAQTSRSSALSTIDNILAPRQEAVALPTNPAAWLEHHHTPPDASQQLASTVWESLEQSQQESLIAEISELVHRHIVTSTLDSDFRNTMEAHMSQRLQNVGGDGERVQEFIQSLPRVIHRRNDFSDLGILGAVGGQAAQQDQLDNMSVISATAAVSIPYAQSQSNVALTREIRQLKTQMQELQTMMRLSFDLQLDLQRSIRQEVAAGLSMHHQTPQTAADQLEPSPVQGQQPSTASTSALTTRPIDDQRCIICLDRGADSVLYQCGHLCTCYTCGLQLKRTGACCPLCRAPIRDIIRAYRSGHNEA